ncbi:MAG: hypothetical protein KKF56_04780 [Nanoarchaeota archaeon]|nr:hypothetical protein [Nanoarchaeota archaeon]
MEKIIQEKISADHLFYVSLKYTKTADVIINLLKRWSSMIELGIEALLKQAKKKKKIKSIPTNPRPRIETAKNAFKKNKEVIDAIELMEFFKRADNAEKQRENEFRKNITLKILDRGKWVDINIDTLKEYANTLENFISQVKQILSK